jgi:DNA-binding response OmpR family regulator
VKPSILIVDDEYGLADLLGEILAEEGYEITLAINGKLGLAALAKKPVHLVLLDVMMPVMDGRQMAQAMRDDPSYRDIPIVMMTAVPDSIPRKEGLYQAILNKPFSLDQLFATIRPLIK